MTAIAIAKAHMNRSSMIRGTAFISASAALGAIVSDTATIRLAFAGVAGFVFIVVAIRLQTFTVIATLVTWLAALGLMRRLISQISPKEAWGDPFLLVGSGVWMVLALLAVRRGAFERSTPLTKAVLVLGALLGVSALNPLQGGFIVGLSGALLVVVPMSAFLVGRSLIDDHMFNRLLWLVAGLGIAVAAYGLLQTFVGFPSWDQHWINSEGYAALNVGGVIRAFSSFSAASEYAGFLGVAMVALIARARGISRWPMFVGAIGFLATALWYESSRGMIVVTIGAVGLMLAARAGLSMSRAFLIGLGVLLILPITIGWIAPTSFSETTGDPLTQHQVEGLTDPFGEYSTLPEHIGLIWDGIESALDAPLGIGVGSITISGGKYGGTVGGAEGDPGRVPFAAGIPGFVAYLAVVFIGLPRVYRFAVLRGDVASIAALGIVFVTILQWVNGGHYAVAFWAWLALGWVDGSCLRTKQERPSSEKVLPVTSNLVQVHR